MLGPGYYTDQENEEKFVASIERARRAPVYAEVLDGFEVRGLHDLASLPFTQKAWMKERPVRDFLATNIDRVWHYHESFGTTGQPVCGWYTLEDFEAEIPLIRTWLDSFHPGAVVLNRYPYSFPVPAQLVEIATRIRGGACIPASNLVYNVSFPRAIDIIRRVGVTTIASMPLEPVMLEECAYLLGLDVKRDLGTVNTFSMAGRIVTPTMKRLIERHWDAQVHNLYGSTEGGPYATSNANGLLRLHTDGFVFEVLDPITKQPVGDGEDGVFVVTTLTREAQPMIRYWTGDQVRLHLTDPELGGGPFIEVLGRVGDELSFGDKEWTVRDLEETILAATEDAYDSLVFFFVATNRGLTVRIETRKPRQHHVQRAIEKDLRAKLGIPIHLEVMKPGGLMNPLGLTGEIKVFKPRMLSDVRHERRFIINHSEAMVDWFADMTPKKMVQQMVRGMRDRLRKLKFRILGR